MIRRALLPFAVAVAVVVVTGGGCSDGGASDAGPLDMMPLSGGRDRRRASVVSDHPRRLRSVVKKYPLVLVLAGPGRRRMAPTPRPTSATPDLAVCAGLLPGRARCRSAARALRVESERRAVSRVRRALPDRDHPRPRVEILDRSWTGLCHRPLAGRRNGAPHGLRRFRRRRRHRQPRRAGDEGSERVRAHQPGLGAGDSRHRRHRHRLQRRRAKVQPASGRFRRRTRRSASGAATMVARVRWQRRARPTPISSPTSTAPRPPSRPTAAVRTGIGVELWSIQNGMHHPLLSPDFATATWAFLTAHARP